MTRVIELAVLPEDREMVQQVAPGPSVAVQVLTIKPKTCTPGVRQTKRNTGSQALIFATRGAKKPRTQACQGTLCSSHFWACHWRGLAPRDAVLRRPGP